MKTEIKFIEMKQKDIKILKEKIWLQNNKKCPLLNIELPLESFALDHIHRLKSEENSINKGVIRNSIEFRANAMEGKISNNWKRYFGADEDKHPISLPNFLRNLADYLEKGAYCETLDNEDTYYIHPNEVAKEPKLMKSSYNELVKINNNKLKIPEWKSSQKLTKVLEKLFIIYNIKPKFYT